MPSILTCDECGLRLLGFESRGPIPIDREACPRCGGDDFTFLPGDE